MSREKTLGIPINISSLKGIKTDSQVMNTCYYPLLLEEHFSPSILNTINLTTRMQSSSSGRQQSLSPHASWSLKQPQTPPYMTTRRRELDLVPKHVIYLLEPLSLPTLAGKTRTHLYFLDSAVAPTAGPGKTNLGHTSSLKPSPFSLYP